MNQRTIWVSLLLNLLACKPSVASQPHQSPVQLSQVSNPNAIPVPAGEQISPPDPTRSNANEKKTIRICIDEAESFPFSFLENNSAHGVHIDITRAAIEAAGFEVEFKFLPWRRCIEHEMVTGSSDAAVSAAWSEPRESYLWYPNDAKALGPKCSSPHALICNGPVLLIPEKTNFQFKENYSEIPQPVRITMGYAQVQDFRKRGLLVDEGPGDPFNVLKMIRDGTGSVLIWKLSLDNLATDDRIKGQYKLVEGFVDLSDGFLPFAKKGRFSQDEAVAVWSALAKLRSNPEFQSGIVARYANRQSGTSESSMSQSDP